MKRRFIIYYAYTSESGEDEVEAESMAEAEEAAWALLNEQHPNDMALDIIAIDDTEWPPAEPATTTTKDPR